MKKMTESSEEAYRDRVTKQDPAEGAEVKPGSTVTVTFGTGPEMVIDPGRRSWACRWTRAKQTAEDAGLNSTDQSAKSDKPKEQVLTDDPVRQRATGQPRRQGPQGLHRQPDLVRQLPVHRCRTSPSRQPAEAVKALNNAGWNGDLSTLQPTGDRGGDHEPSQVGADPGQDPAANTVIDKTAKITRPDRRDQDDHLPDLSV